MTILGPLLFSLYINDMINASAVLFSLLFADDTNVFVTGKNLSNLVESKNTGLKKLIEWMHVNKSSLNIKKTKNMLFTLRKKPWSSDDIVIDYELIGKVEHFKFLGVIIDSKLSWVDHMQFIKKKISKGLGILCNAKRVLKLQTLLISCYSFIYPFMLYCIEIWGSASK